MPPLLPLHAQRQHRAARLLRPPRRCVSLPFSRDGLRADAWMALLAAFRGRVLRAAAEGSDDASSSMSGASSGGAGSADFPVHRELLQEMYFV